MGRKECWRGCWFGVVGRDEVNPKCPRESVWMPRSHRPQPLLKKRQLWLFTGQGGWCWAMDSGPVLGECDGLHHELKN